MHDWAQRLARNCTSDETAQSCVMLICEVGGILKRRTRSGRHEVGLGARHNSLLLRSNLNV